MSMLNIFVLLLPILRCIEAAGDSVLQNDGDGDALHEEDTPSPYEEPFNPLLPDPPHKTLYQGHLLEEASEEDMHHLGDHLEENGFAVGGFFDKNAEGAEALMQAFREAANNQVRNSIV